MSVPAPAVTLRALQLSDVDLIFEFQARNRADMEATGPPRPASAWERPGVQQRVERIVADMAAGTAMYWIVEAGGSFAGDIALNHIARGSLQSANVGYLIDAAWRGRGVATAALRAVAKEAFGPLRLHRLEAGAMPTNIGSLRVLEGAGFRRVGITERLLLIGTTWRDHVYYELVGPDFDLEPIP